MLAAIGLMLPVSVYASLRAGDAAQPGGDVVITRAMTTLRGNMVGHAMLNGVPITDLVAKGSCASELVTMAGRIRIDWSKVGNLASETVGGSEVIAVETLEGRKRSVIPSGDRADRVIMGMGLLAQRCESL